MDSDPSQKIDPVPVRRGRGRPKGAKNRVPSLASPLQPNLDPFDRRKLLLMAKEQAKELASRAKADEVRQDLRLQTVARLQAARAAFMTRPAAQYLDREARLAWLCERIAETHVVSKPISLGQGMGVELVEVPTIEPNFRAMELLMKACGDFPASSSVKVGVAVGGGGEAPDQARPTVVFIQHDNGRGPVPAAMLEQVGAGALPDVVEAPVQHPEPEVDADGFEVFR